MTDKDLTVSRPGRWLANVALTLVTATTSPLAAPTFELVDTAMNLSEPIPYCVGRFRLHVAKSMAPTGRSQQIYRVDISTGARPSGVPAPSVWADRLTVIRGGKPSSPDPVIRSFDLEPGVPAAWYYARPNDRFHITLEAMKPFKDHILRLVYEITGEPQSATESAYRRILAGYVPGGKTGFCMEHGSLTSEPSRNEHTNIAFQHTAVRELKLTFASDSVDKPDTRDMLRDVEEERKLLLEAGSEVEILQNGPRTVAQLQGVDARIRMLARDTAPFVRFTWRYAGNAKNATTPQITVVAVAPVAHQATLEAVWETLLNGLQPAPQPPGSR